MLALDLVNLTALTERTSGSPDVTIGLVDGPVAPAICPDCTLLLRPIFAETTSGREQMPSAL